MVWRSEKSFVCPGKSEGQREGKKAREKERDVKKKNENEKKQSMVKLTLRKAVTQ